MMRCSVLLAMTTATTMLVTGCAGPTTQTPSQYRAELAQLTYPEQAEAGRNLDIHVVRRGNSVVLANRTPRDYEQMQLWINGEYVRKIDRLTIGTDNRYGLNQFVNRHGDRFPLPGLLTPLKTQPVVKATLYNPRTEQRHRLTVQPDDTQDE